MITKFTIELPRPDETAIIICNGPSLRDFDLKSLPKVATFGMNAAYRHWDRIGWYPTHFACLDEVVGLHHASAIGDMIARNGKNGPSHFLLRDNAISHLGEHIGETDVKSYDSLADTIASLARQPVTTGSHTLIWALTLGYRSIFLLGADSNYVEVVEGAEFVEETVLEIAREAENPNYFFDDYQQLGDRHNLPNIGGETHLRSWRVAAAVAAEMDAQVYNLSKVSRSDAFDFVQIEDFIAGRRLVVTPRETRRLRLRVPAVQAAAST
jgi:hypothetical protein